MHSILPTMICFGAIRRIRFHCPLFKTYSSQATRYFYQNTMGIYWDLTCPGIRILKFSNPASLFPAPYIKTQISAWLNCTTRFSSKLKLEFSFQEQELKNMRRKQTLISSAFSKKTPITLSLLGMIHLTT